MDEKHKIIFCGILNFWKSDFGYQTSDRWLYVSFALSSQYHAPNLVPNLVIDADPRDLIQSSGPRMQSWDIFNYSPGYEEIKTRDLRKMGMKVTTLYLK